MTSPPDAVPETPWLRLNRKMLLIRPVQEVGRGLIPLVALFVSGLHNPTQELLTLAGALALIGFGIVRYATTFYRITPKQVQIRRGLLNRKLSVAPLDRVRTVDVTSPFLHRVLGLGRVVIGTGRTDIKRQHDLVLDGLTEAEATALRTGLLQRAPQATSPTFDPATSDPPSTDPTSTDPTRYAGDVGRVGAARAYVAPPLDVELVRLQPAWIGYAPFTLSGAVTALVILGFGWRLVNETRLDPARFALTRDAIDSLRRTPLWLDVVQILVVVLLVVVVLSVIGYVLAFWGFRLTRRPDGTLHVERGLITRRQTTLEQRRVRGVELSEPLLLRAVRGARLIAIATGLRVGRGSERGGTILVPPSPRAVSQTVGAAVVGSPAAVSTGLLAHGSVATRRRYTRAMVPTLVVVVALAGLALGGALPSWAGLTPIALLPLAALLAADRARSLGHALIGPIVVTRYGSLVRRRVVLDVAGVIGANVRASVFQRRAGVCSVHLTTAAGRQSYSIVDLPVAQAWAFVHAVLPAVRLPTEHPGPVR